MSTSIDGGMLLRGSTQIGHYMTYIQDSKKVTTSGSVATGTIS